MAPLNSTVRFMRTTLLALCALSTGCDPSSFDMPGQRDASVEVDPHSTSPTDGAVSGSGPREAGATLPGEPQLDAARPSGSSWWIDARSEPSQPADASSEVTPATHDAAPGEAKDANTSCGDTQRDAKNCGSCGYDCSAPAAVVSCVNGTCNRTCASGFDDCDNDRIHGSAGNGCETRVDSNVNNCGACRKRCVAPEYGFASCSNQLCSGHTLSLRDPLPSMPHGTSSGGGPFALPCAPGEVVTGISGLGDDYIIYAFRVHCARLEMKRSNGVINVGTRATWMTEQAGGVNLVPVASFSRTCPPNMIVTRVSGSTSFYNEQATTPSLQRLSLGCSTVKVDAALEITLEAGPTLQIGQDTPAPIEVFHEPCAGVGAVGGFSGRSGAYLDAVAVHCGALELRETVAGTVMIPEATSSGSE